MIRAFLQSVLVSQSVLDGVQGETLWGGEGEDSTLADATTTTTTTTTAATTTTALLLSKQPDEALFGVQLGQDTTEAKQAKPLVVENRKWSMRPSGCGGLAAASGFRWRQRAGRVD